MPPSPPRQAEDAPTRRVLLLGATGSIGRQTVEVVEHLARVGKRDPQRTGGLSASANAARSAPASPRVEIVGLAAGERSEELFRLAARLGVRDLALVSNGKEHTPPPGARLRLGADAAERLVREVDADVVVAAMVGAAGLPATLAALERGRDVALANKETLACAGALVVSTARRSGARLLPIDSEHSAAWQCLPAGLCPPCELGPEVRRLVLTASGGPFRTTPLEEMRGATPEAALDHPTWSMGPKVTIDSATMMNKALEMLEAHWLFGLEGERIGVLVHPTSIAHAMIEYADGSVIAQLGAPDMRTPIQHALTWPRRLPGLAPAPDLPAQASLPFEAPDERRFPALALAREVIALAGCAGAVFNAANEAAVEAFLRRRIPFGAVTELVGEALHSLAPQARPEAAPSLEEIREADRRARAFVRERLNTASPPAHAGAASGRSGGDARR